LAGLFNKDISVTDVTLQMLD